VADSLTQSVMVSCPQHSKPVQGCRECHTADDVNAAGHMQGNCISDQCDWHKLDRALRGMKPPGAALRMIRGWLGG